MLSVQLEVEDWNKVLAILAQAPWAQANPLIMAIGGQLRGQQGGAHERSVGEANHRGNSGVDRPS